MLDVYANQAIIRKTPTGSVSDTNEPAYTTTTIYGRKEGKTRLILNQQGEQVVASGTVYTESLVLADDQLDGAHVINILPQPGLDGVTKFYEVLLT